MVLFSLLVSVAALLVPHVNSVSAFDFQMDSFSRDFDDTEICHANLTATQEQIVFFVATRQTGAFWKSNGITYRNFIYTEEVVDPEQVVYNVTDFGIQDSASREVAIAYAIRRHNVTHCRISRIVRSQVVISAISTVNDTAWTSQKFLGYNCSNNSANAGNYTKYKQSACSVNRTLDDVTNASNSTGPYYYVFKNQIILSAFLTAKRPIHNFILSRQTTGADWGSKNFWRLLWVGPYASRHYWMTMDLYSGWSIWGDSYKIGGYGDYSYPWDRLYNDRLNADLGVGIKVLASEKLQLDFTTNCRSKGMAATYHVYNLSELESSSATATIKGQTYVGDSNIYILTELAIKLSFSSNKTLLMELTLVSNNSFFPSFTNTTTMAFNTTWQVGTATLPDDSVTLLLSFGSSLMDVGATGSNKALSTAIGTVVIYNMEAHNKTGNPLSIGSTIKKKSFSIRMEQEFVDNINFDIAATGNKYWMQATCSDGVQRNIRVRAIGGVSLIPDYDLLLNSSYSASISTKQNLCHMTIPDDLLPANTLNACAGFWYGKSGGTSWSPNCFQKVYDTNPCDYCDPGYGTDLINNFVYPSWMACRSYADCNQADNYYVWDEGFLTPNVTTKSLCTSCPLNCPSCKTNQECLTCSNFSTLNTTSKRCECMMDDCAHCTDKTCNRCSQFNAKLLKGYVLHIDRTVTPELRSCSYRATNSCLPGFGFTYNDPYPFKGIEDWPACETCLLTGCLLCPLNSSNCTKCGSSLSLANLSDALNTSFVNNTQVCVTTSSTTYKGLVEIVVNNTFVKCISNCWTCLASDVANCTQCAPDYYYVPYNKSCVLNFTKNSKCYLTPLPLTMGSTKCVKCMSNCDYCNSTSNCIMCTPNYWYDPVRINCTNQNYCGKASMNYRTQQYRVDGNYDTCLDCISQCINCTNSTGCIDCSPGFYLMTNMTCMNSAACRSTKSYPNAANVSHPVCTACGRGCEWCWSSTSCDSCLNNQTFAFHIGQNLCVLNTSCVHTNKSWFDTPANQCRYCKTTCTGCTSGLDCWLCDPGLFLDINNASCFSACQTYQTNMNSTHCIACPPNCKTCSFDNGTGNFTCLTCDTEYYIDAEGTCNPCTSRGLFPNGTRCEVCVAEDCERCVNLSTTCKICDLGFFVNSSKTCEPCLPPNVYTFDRLCLTCEPENCLECNAYDIKKCINCSIGYMVDSNNLCGPRAFVVTEHEFRLKTLKFKLVFEQKILPFEPEDVIVSFINGDDELEATVVKVSLISVDKTNARVYYLTVDKAPIYTNFIPQVVFPVVTKIVSEEKPGYYMSESSKTLIFPMQGQYIAEDLAQASAASNAMSTGMNVAIIASSIISFNYAAIMMKIYQMMDFMLLYSVNYPVNFEKFISVFNAGNPVDMLPDVFVGLYDDGCKELGEKFESQGMACQFMQNTSTTFLVFIIWFGGKVLLTILCFALQSCPKIVSKFTAVKVKVFGPKMLFMLISMFDVDIHLGAFTNSKFYAGDDNSSQKAITNNLLANSYIYLYPLLIFYYFYKNRQLVQYEQGKLHRLPPSTIQYEFLIQEHRLDSNYGQYLEPFGLAKNYLICSFVVGLYRYPRLQLSAVFCILLISFIAESKWRPREKSAENFVQQCAAGLYSVITLLFLSVDLLEARGVSKKAVYIYVGYPLTGLFGILIFVNIIPSVIDMVKSVKELYLKCKNKDKSKKIEEMDASQAPLTQSRKHIGIPRRVKKDLATLDESSILSKGATILSSQTLANRVRRPRNLPASPIKDSPRKDRVMTSGSSRAFIGSTIRDTDQSTATKNQTAGNKLQ